MVVDFWIIGLFATLFGICAVMNYKRGFRRGILVTVYALEKEKIISLDKNSNEIIPYRKTSL